MGLLAIAGGIAANGRTVAFLVAPALALAASANLSTLVHTLFRRLHDGYAGTSRAVSARPRYR